MGLDVLGYRRLFGVLGPSTNTTVQPDFDDMRPHGVTNHYSRIFTPNSKAISDETFYNATKVISGNVLDAVRSVMTCEPDYLVMGMSAVTFYGGAKGADDFQRMVEKESGVGISCGSHSCAAALKAYGGIKRIAFLSPYYPVANAEVSRFYGDCGFTVVRDVCLRRPSPVQIAHTTDAMCRAAIRELDGDDVDAIVQVGTNLAAIETCAQAEVWLGKPVLAINAITYWDALRRSGIEDKIHGYGSVLERF